MSEVIELFDWDDCIETDNIYIRGHVTDDEASAIFRDWYEDVFVEDAPVMGPWRHRYARWSTEADGLRLRVYAEPGRGRFPVTVASQGVRCGYA